MMPLRRWEEMEYAAAAIVILGVFGEYLAEFHVFREKGQEDKAQAEEREYKRRRFARWSTLILLGGLAIELLALVRTSQLYELRISELNNEANTSALEAAGANTVSGIAQVQAGLANERAAKIEEENRARHLTVEHRDAMLRILRTRKGSVRVGYASPAEFDAEEYAIEIESVFRSAGWKIERLHHLGTEEQEALPLARLATAHGLPGVEAPGQRTGRALPSEGHLN